MKKVLTDIQDGTFAKDWLLENRLNAPAFNAKRKMELEHKSVEVGKDLRNLMGFGKRLVD